jgi:Peptidase family M28
VQTLLCMILRITLGLFLILTSMAAAQDARRVAIDAIKADDIHRDIFFLTDDRFKGRFCRSPEAREAAKWIATQFEQAGLTPVANHQADAPFFHSIGDDTLAPNVIAMRKGSGDRLIVITAHYDHLRELPSTEHPMSREGRTIFAGADDNASGVCGMIAIARAMKTADLQLDSSVVFIAFSAEEIGLRGARFVAGQPPFSLASVDALLNMDMISRGEADLIFIDGPGYATELKQRLLAANQQLVTETPGHALRIELDKHPDWLMRSDQGPFIRRRVPCVLFSVEDHPDYHQVTDTPDKVLPELAQRVARLVLATTVDLSQNPPKPIQPAQTQPTSGPTTAPATRSVR